MLNTEPDKDAPPSLKFLTGHTNLNITQHLHRIIQIDVFKVFSIRGKPTRDRCTVHTAVGRY